MRGTRSILAILVLVTMAALVGIGAVAAKGPDSKATIVLWSGEDSITQDFGLRNRDRDEMSVSVAKDVLTDRGGKVLGAHHWQCQQSSLAWYCTGVLVLDETGATRAGSITVAGLFGGFDGESLAITGGTGAYAGARGTVVLSVEDERFVRTVKLLP